MRNKNRGTAKALVLAFVLAGALHSSAMAAEAGPLAKFIGLVSTTCDRARRPLPRSAAWRLS